MDCYSKISLCLCKITFMNNSNLVVCLLSRRGIELVWEFPDVQYCSSLSARPSAIASINTVNH